MNLPLYKISADAAMKEFRRYMVISVVGVVVVAFVFGWLAVIPIGAAARCISLTFHPGVKENPGIKKLRVYAIVVFCVAVSEFALYLVRG